ncbi:MAG: transcriptional regulator [Bifidobacteriaceae bacterium]|jgi:DNA-binding MarR family transcriptional regulator|nr:transcriptional regulator [Bifidobacteriaceae bacterium]
MASVELDPMIHPAARLRLMTALAALPPGEEASFGQLERQLEMTVGNLSSHLSKLEAAGYIEVAKGFAGKRPITTIKLSAGGWSAFQRYLENLNRVLDGLS